MPGWPARGIAKRLNPRGWEPDWKRQYKSTKKELDKTKNNALGLRIELDDTLEINQELTRSLIEIIHMSRTLMSQIKSYSPKDLIEVAENYIASSEKVLLKAREHDLRYRPIPGREVDAG